jgi:hypothetical protein
MEINPREEENQNSELAESELKITPIISQSLFYEYKAYYVAFIRSSLQRPPTLRRYSLLLKCSNTKERSKF